MLAAPIEARNEDFAESLRTGEEHTSSARCSSRVHVQSRGIQALLAVNGELLDGTSNFILFLKFTKCCINQSCYS